MVCTLNKYFQRSLLVDSRKQAGRSTEEIGDCLEPKFGNPDRQGAYTVLKRWYHHVSVRTPNPLWADMAKVMGD